jgi:hypothetical protein
MLLDGDLDSSFRFRHRLSLGIELVVRKHLPAVALSKRVAWDKISAALVLPISSSFGLDAGTLLPGTKKVLCNFSFVSERVLVEF